MFTHSDTIVVTVIGLCISSATAFTSIRLHRLDHKFVSAFKNRKINPPTLQSIKLKMSSASMISSNEDLQSGIAAIDKSNNALLETLETLRDNPDFRYYSVDILASCEYMPQELFECYSETCEIYPVDEDEVPEEIRELDHEESTFELDGWGRWDMPNEDYYDIQQFPEAYTGYDGSDVWNFIHDRICFSGYDYDDNHWKADFNKAVSGLHSMISAHTVRGIKERLDDEEPFTEKEVWRNPEKEFTRRLGPNGETPLALENLYFTYMLLLYATRAARDRLIRDCESGKICSEAIDELKNLLSSSLVNDPSIDVAFSKLHDDTIKDQDSKESLWEARMRTRELLRIMNCVQCNKCRLHGKIAVMGLSTALQLLVGRSGDGGDPTRIHRVELAALVTTLHKFATAVEFCQKMSI